MVLGDMGVDIHENSPQALAIHKPLHMFRSTHHQSLNGIQGCNGDSGILMVGHIFYHRT